MHHAIATRRARSPLAAAVSLLLTLGAAVLLSLTTSTTAQAAPTWQSHSTAMTNAPSGDAATSLVIPKPGGVAVGNVLIAQVTFEKGNAAGGNGQITPAGWERELRTNEGSDLGQAIFYRVATSADLTATSYTFPFGQSVKAAGAISRYTGVDTTDPIVGSDGRSGSSGSLIAPTVTGVVGSRVVTFFGLKKTSSTLSTSSPGMTEKYEFANPQDVRVMSAEDNAVRASNGATGDRTSTASPSSEKWVGQQITLRPTSNTAPTVGSISGPASVNEGSLSSYSVAASDPDADTLTYAWSVQSGNGSLSGPGNGAAANVAFGDGPSVVSLRVVVDDGNSHTETRNLSVTVGNVAPTALFGAPASVQEGSAINLSLGSVTDPSGADTAAGFTYAFDCGSGYGSFGPASATSCATSDNGTRTVGGRVRDKDGGVSTYTATVTITNAAPTATFSHTGPVDEGSDFGLSLTLPADPSSADTAAGFTYQFDCGAGFGPAGPASAATCGTEDNGPHPVKGKIFDKDGGWTEYTASVPVDSVAPTAVFAAPSAVDEGGDIDLALNGATDVSSADAAAGFDYAFDCGDGAGYVATGGSTTSCTTTDNGSRSVGGQVGDKNGATSTYTSTVTVNNVAPSGTFSPAGVDEGSSIQLSVADVADPGTDDVLEYAFSCDGSTYGAFGPDHAATCPTDDNGDRLVGAKVRDDDGGETTLTASVEVANVDPVATMVVNPTGPINEGSSFTVTLTDPVDPSPVDAASLTYAFDCGSGVWSDPDVADSMTCTPDDNTAPAMPLKVRAKVIDKDGGESPYLQDVDVQNVAPVGTFGAPASVTEGESIDLSVTDVFDPSGADMVVGFTFAFDCGDGSFGAFTSDATTACATNDNTPADDPLVVRARVKDKDGDYSESTKLVTVINVAPSATFVTADVDEGSDIALELTGPEDPSSVDTAAGFTYAFDCGDGSGLGSFGPSSSTTCSTNDDGSRTVTGAIQDKDGGITEYTVGLTVRNVAPSGLFAADDVDEGTPISLSITGVTDPSSADTVAGFEYAFDCGDGYGDWGSTTTASCPTLDNGSRDVGGKVRDKDDGVSESTLTVTIDNVAPIGTFTAPATVAEGGDIDLAVTDPSDPSPTDTGAGFTYSFDCGDGPRAYAPASTRTCPTDDDGSRNVSGAIQDKDLESTTYYATVTIDNVAPSATFSSPVAVDEGQEIVLALLGPTDPSSVDTAAGFSYAFDCGTGYGAFGPSSSETCPTTDNGVRTVGGKVRDKDGGVREYTMSVTVNNVAPDVVAPSGQSTLPGIATSFALGSFGDPGVDDDPWAVNVSWGDGLTDAFNLSTQGSLGSLSHTYALAGSYTATVRVTDKDSGWYEASFVVEVNLTDKVLLGNEDVEISGAKSRIIGDVHANRDIKISGSGGDICGNLTAGRSIQKMGTQSCGTTTAPAPLVPLPNMADYVPTTVTHTLTGDRTLNGYTCAVATGCVVKVTGKLEIRGVIMGKVWFLVEKDVVIKGDLGPANPESRLRIYSMLTLDAPVSKATISGQFLAEQGLKLNGSTQLLTGLFWGKQYVDMSGSSGSLRGAVVSNGFIKLAGSSRTLTYDASVIRF